MAASNTTDEAYMGEALQLARSVAGSVSPRPPVGAVIVNQSGDIVGRGATEFRNGRHAEEVAIADAGSRARGGRMFCTLEPHSFQSSRTPCTDSIIQAGLAEVIAGLPDPNPRQKSAEPIFAAAGVRFQYQSEPYERELRQLIEGFNKHILTGLPFITAKLALTADGKSATKTGDSKWITSDEARQWAHDNLRGVSDAILTTADTAMSDNARLTARLSDGVVKTPSRLILDRTCKLPQTAAVLQSPGECVVFIGEGRQARFGSSNSNVQCCEVAETEQGLDLSTVLEAIGAMGYCSVLVESGATLLGTLLDSELIDRFEIFIAPKVFGGKDAPSGIGGAGAVNTADALSLRDVQCQFIGDNLHISGYSQKVYGEE